MAEALRPRPFAWAIPCSGFLNVAGGLGILMSSGLMIGRRFRTWSCEAWLQCSENAGLQ